MSLLTGKDEKEPATLTSDEVMAELQEFRLLLKKINIPWATENKERLAAQKKLQDEINQAIDQCQKCMSEINLTDDNVGMLKQIVEKDRADTKKSLAKIQADLKAAVETFAKEEQAEQQEEANEVSLEIVQHDMNGKTKRIMMTKGSRKIAMDVVRNQHGNASKIIMTRQ